MGVDNTGAAWILRRIQGTVLAILAVVYMIGATSWSMPDGFPLKRVIDQRYRPAFQWLGLWQGWDMFAPQPRDEDIYVSAEIYFADGTKETRALTRMIEMPYLERYSKERWRKFFNDNLRLDANKSMWEPGAAWIAREAAASSGREVDRVELVRSWRKSLLPRDAGDVMNDQRPYNRFVFHNWKARK
jgi:hypothetical protein